MAHEKVLVRFRHQIPGYSVGEVAGYSPVIAQRLVDDLYAEFYHPPQEEAEASTEENSGSSTEDRKESGQKEVKRRRRKQMSTGAGGTPYPTK